MTTELLMKRNVTYFVYAVQLNDEEKNFLKDS